MPSDLQVSNIKANDGTAGISIADSTGNVSLSGTLSAGTLGASVSFPYDGTTDAGRVIQVKHLTSRETNSLDSSWTVRWNYSLTLKSGDSRIMVLHTENTYCANNSGYGVKVYRNNSVYNDSVTTITGTAVYDDIPLASNNKSHMVYIYDSELYTINPINFVDDVSSFNAGDTVYYGHYYQEYTGTAQVPAGGHSGNDGAFITIIMELEK